MAIIYLFLEGQEVMDFMAKDGALLVLDYRLLLLL